VEGFYFKTGISNVTFSQLRREKADSLTIGAVGGRAGWTPTLRGLPAKEGLAASSALPWKVQQLPT
jgi:hypothetical protein